jgi:hypothetical protein
LSWRVQRVSGEIPKWLLARRSEDIASYDADHRVMKLSYK